MNRPKSLTSKTMSGIAVLSSITIALSVFLARPEQAQAKKMMTRYAAPTPGTVRVIAHSIRNDANEVEWYWTVIGDRYWGGMRSDSLGSVTLSSGDSSLKPDNGTNVFEIHIKTRAQQEPVGTPSLVTESSVVQLPQIFRRTDGSWMSLPDGRTNAGKGSEPLKKRVAANRAGSALFTGDKTFPLPLRLALYERNFGLDGTEVQTRNAQSYLGISR